MRISRFGNKSSEILNSFLDKTEESTPEESQFKKIASQIAEQKKTSLRDVLAQFALEEEPLDAGMDSELPPPETDMPETDIPEPTEGLGTEDSEVKQHLVDALIALCGDVESAKACLDELGGGMGMDEDMGEIPPEEPSLEEDMAEPEMPAPDEMQAQPMPQPGMM